MKEVKPRRNTPIAQLIKNYRDKKSGKVSAARNEIQWRFDALDWRHQKQGTMCNFFITQGGHCPFWYTIRCI